MTRREFTTWVQDTFLATGDGPGPDCLGNVDDRLLIFDFPDGTRFCLAVLEEPTVSNVSARLAQGHLPLIRIVDEDLEEG